VKKRMLLILPVACMLLWSGAANAQDSFKVEKALPEINSKITVFTGAPAGFDPVKASDDELLAYGYPRRPDISEKKAYSYWLKAVSCTRVNPDFTPVPGRFHNIQNLKSLGTVDSTTTYYTSGNWSGYALYDASPGTEKYREVVGVWPVPNVGSQASTEAKTDMYSSMWVGIDGDGTSDLIQDGTEQDWNAGTAFYAAWVEMLPAAELRISTSAFPIQPGDFLYAYSEVVVPTSGTTYGKYYIANYNTRLAASATINLPSSVSYHGESAEWIVERTQVNGSFENPMPRYGHAYMDAAYAYRTTGGGICYLCEANQNITMVNGSDNLSSVGEQDLDSMLFTWDNYQ